MKILWRVEGRSDFEEYAQLQDRDGTYELIVWDGVEGADIKLSTEQLLDLAYTIYEELG